MSEMAAVVGTLSSTPAGGGGGTAVIELPSPTGEGEGGGTGTGGAGEGGGEGGEEPALPGAGADDARPEGEDKTPKEGEEDLTPGDGRTVDDRTKKALSSLRKVDPQAATRMQDMYYQNQSVLKETGKTSFKEALSEIRSNRATIDSLGGEEGINNLNTEVGDYRKEIKQFADGDPALLQDLYDSNADSAVRAGENLLGIIAGKSVEQLDRLIIPHMAARLEAVGVRGAIQKIGKFLLDGKGQDAYDHIAHLGKFFDSLMGESKKLTEGKTRPDPERERLQTERQSFEKEKTEQFDTTIGTSVNNLTTLATSKVVSKFLNDAGIQGEGRKAFVGPLMNRVFAAIKADQTFQRQFKAIKGKGDPQAAAKFIADKYEELLPDMFESHRNWLYPNFKPKAKVRTDAATTTTRAATPQKQAPKDPDQQRAQNATDASNATWVNGKPNSADIDWDKTKEIFGDPDIAFISGRVVMKAGKFAGKVVRWRVKSD